MAEAAGGAPKSIKNVLSAAQFIPRRASELGSTLERHTATVQSLLINDFAF
jgi:hypothetical protein